MPPYHDQHQTTRPQRPAPRYRKSQRAARTRGGASLGRLGLILAVAVVLGAVGWTAIGSNEPPEASAVSASVEPTGTAEVEQVTHVTFGAHDKARQACSTCHDDSVELPCRTCHGFTCGKDSKTVGDCLACHKTGTTDEWLP